MTYSAPSSLLHKLVARAADKAPAPRACTHRIPVTDYTDTARFERELRLIHNSPVILGHESQIPTPGDAIVHDWLGLPLITLRDKHGAIGTFYNVCRHRGMRLLQDEGKTCVKSLVCPYHQWTYGLDGTLRNIPRQEMFTDLDNAALGLAPVATAVRGGLIWVQVEGEMTLDDDLAGLEKDLDSFSLPDYTFCAQHVRSVACNWKLIQDAFLDGYHVTRLHKNTVGPFFPDSLAESDALGNHIRSAVARNEIFDALHLSEQELDLRHHATFSYTIFPNAVLIFHPDYTSIIGLYPQGPDETIFAHTMLTPTAPTSENERDHFQRSFDLIDQGVFQAEDIFVSIGAQHGMRSGVNSDLIFGGLEEAAIAFHTTLARELTQY